MGKRQTPEETLRKAKDKGAGHETGIVDGKPCFRKLEPGTKKNYQRQLNLWHEFVRQNPSASPYDLVSLQKFVRDMAYAIDGAEGIKEGCTETVRKYWNAFTAAWRRANSESPEIPRDTVRSVTNFIKGPLKEEIGLTNSKRPRRFATKTHLLHFARQLWMTDWFEYKTPATRLDDWLLHLANTFSSSRIGEYIESNCRPGSGRGLYYRDITFGAFVNEYGNPEFAVQLTRDAKNMADTPEKRPQHALYEGAVPMILCFNPMLPFLARLLVHGAFRDYGTIEELLGIMPPEDEMLQLHWKDQLLDTPFFKAQSSQNSEERIETADAFSKRHRAWGLRAGYPKPPPGHDFRAEGLYWIDKFYSEATRMVHAGHTDSNTLRRHYMPTNGADGQDTYLGGKGRTIVADLFRGLTVPRNPNLSQCLPAEKQFDLENTPDYVALSEEITTLEGKTDTESVMCRRKLYRERRTLTEKELREWQKRQPNRPSDRPGYHRAIFSRVNFMMPERDNLSHDLFTIDTLRSPTGLHTLHAMVALYQQESEVDYRPGLEPDKCSCSKSRGTKLEGTRAVSYEWKHIYICYKRSCERMCGFAELCFLCNEWVSGEEAWEDHCDGHLSLLHEFPMFCDPLSHGGVLATAGHCPFCLTDKRLPASVRMKQFLNHGSWLDHIHKHISDLDKEKPLKCPHPQLYCATLFDSIQQLQFHLQDAHGIPFVRATGRSKRKRDESEDELPVQRKGQIPGLKAEADTDEVTGKWEYAFINSTTKHMHDHRTSSIKSSSGYSTPLLSSDSTLAGVEVPHHHETAPSSVCSEELIDPEILPRAKGQDLDIVDVGDLISIDNVFSPQFPAAETTASDPASLGEANGGTLIRFTLNQGDTSVQDTTQDAIWEAARKGYPSIADEEPNYSCPPAVDPDDDQFEVERLIEKRRVGRGVQYLVKWRGYPDSKNTWEKKTDIHSGIVAAFEAELAMGSEGNLDT